MSLVMYPTPPSSSRPTKSPDPTANLTITYTFRDPRELSPVVFHFVVLRVAAVIGLVHLTSLQRASKQSRTQSLALFICLPTIVLASVICRLLYCLRLATTRNWPSDRSGYLAYLLCAILGQRTWANGASLIPQIERDARVSDLFREVNDNSNSSSLFLVDPSYVQRLKCTCAARVCQRYKSASFLRTTSLLVLIFSYCLATFLVYLRRCTTTYAYMAGELLQGTPPGSHEVRIYSNALETVAGFDQLSAVWAIGGMVVTLSALLLKTVGNEFATKDLGNEPNLEEKTSASELQMFFYGEFALSLVLLIFFTQQSWARAYLTWRSAHPWRSLFFLLSKLWSGFFALYLTYCWVHGIENWKKETKGATVILAWIVFVSLFPSVYAERDAWQLVTCVSGGECQYPLFLWKDAWSDYLWVY